MGKLWPRENGMHLNKKKNIEKKITDKQKKNVYGVGEYLGKNNNAIFIE